jgi:DNA-binding LacI/PurR family transcriptional regulator
MAATLKDIADRVNVSIVTVSKVLNGTGNISVATRHRVLKVAKELNYRPNAQARAIRSGRTGNVGFVYSSEGMGHGLPWSFLDGVNERLAGLKLNLVVGALPNERLLQAGNLSGLLQNWTADGMLIFNQVDLPPGVQDLIDREHVPVVWVNRKQKYNSVYFDDFNGARLAVEHLMALGHKRIAYFDHSHVQDSFAHPIHYSQQERLTGYVEAMETFGLEPIVCLPTEKVGGEARIELYRNWLRHPRKPTAVLMYGRANSVLYAALSLGIRIPQDLSILTFSENVDAMNGLVPGLVFTPYRTLGEEAVALLHRRIQEPELGQPSVGIPLSVIPNETCAPPPGQ